MELHHVRHLTEGEHNKMKLSEGELEVIIPAILLIFWVIILIVAVYFTYKCLKKRPQNYKTVPVRNILSVEMQTSTSYGYDQ